MGVWACRRIDVWAYGRGRHALGAANEKELWDL